MNGYAGTYRSGPLDVTDLKIFGSEKEYRFLMRLFSLYASTTTNKPVINVERIQSGGTIKYGLFYLPYMQKSSNGRLHIDASAWMTFHIKYTVYGQLKNGKWSAKTYDYRTNASEHIYNYDFSEIIAIQIDEINNPASIYWEIPGVENIKIIETAEPLIAVAFFPGYLVNKRNIKIYKKVFIKNIFQQTSKTDDSFENVTVTAINVPDGINIRFGRATRDDETPNITIQPDTEFTEQLTIPLIGPQDVIPIWIEHEITDASVVDETFHYDIRFDIGGSNLQSHPVEWEGVSLSGVWITHNVYGIDNEFEPLMKLTLSWTNVSGYITGIQLQHQLTSASGIVADWYTEKIVHVADLSESTHVFYISTNRPDLTHKFRARLLGIENDTSEWSPVATIHPYYPDDRDPVPIILDASGEEFSIVLKDTSNLALPLIETKEIMYSTDPNFATYELLRFDGSQFTFKPKETGRIYYFKGRALKRGNLNPPIDQGWGDVVSAKSKGVEVSLSSPVSWINPSLSGYYTTDKIYEPVDDIIKPFVKLIVSWNEISGNITAFEVHHSYSPTGVYTPIAEIPVSGLTLISGQYDLKVLPANIHETNYYKVRGRSYTGETTSFTDYYELDPFDEYENDPQPITLNVTHNVDYFQIEWDEIAQNYNETFECYEIAISPYNDFSTAIYIRTVGTSITFTPDSYTTYYFKGRALMKAKPDYDHSLDGWGTIISSTLQKRNLDTIDDGVTYGRVRNTELADGKVKQLSSGTLTVTIDEINEDIERASAISQDNLLENGSFERYSAHAGDIISSKEYWKIIFGNESDFNVVTDANAPTQYVGKLTRSGSNVVIRSANRTRNSIRYYDVEGKDVIEFSFWGKTSNINVKLKAGITEYDSDLQKITDRYITVNNTNWQNYRNIWTLNENTRYIVVFAGAYDNDGEVYIDELRTRILQHSLSNISGVVIVNGKDNKIIATDGNTLVDLENKRIQNTDIDETNDVSDDALSNNIFKKNVDTLDDISDGVTYGKVRASEINNGRVIRLDDGSHQVTASEGKAAYEHSQTTSGNPHNVKAVEITDFDTEVENNSHVVTAYNHSQETGNPHNATLDDIPDGSDRVLPTESTNPSGQVVRVYDDNGNVIVSGPSGIIYSTDGEILIDLISKKMRNTTIDDSNNIADGALSDNIFKKDTDDLDDIADGTTYGRVRQSEINNGRVIRLDDGSNQVTASEAKSAYKHSQLSGNPHGATLDDIPDGSDYERVKATEVVNGKVIRLDDGVDQVTASQAKTAYNHSQETGNPHGATLDDIPDGTGRVLPTASTDPSGHVVRVYDDEGNVIVSGPSGVIRSINGDTLIDLENKKIQNTVIDGTNDVKDEALSDNIFKMNYNTLDEIYDGIAYKKVRSEILVAGKVKKVVDNNQNTIVDGDNKKIKSPDGTDLIDLENKKIQNTIIDNSNKVDDGALSKNIFKKNVDTLDDVPDGTKYERVKATEVSNGKVVRLDDGTNQVTASEAKTAYDHSQATGNPHNATLDDINDGSTYGRVRNTELVDGRIKKVVYDNGNSLIENKRIKAPDGTDLIELDYKKIRHTTIDSTNDIDDEALSSKVQEAVNNAWIETQSNMVDNPTFERRIGGSLQPWKKFWRKSNEFDVVEDTSAPSKYVCKITRSGSDIAIEAADQEGTDKKYFRVRPGDLVIFEYWVKTSGSRAKVGFALLDKNLSNPVWYYQNSTDTSWTYKRYTFKVPSGKYWMYIFAGAYDDDGYVMIDDIRMRIVQNYIADTDGNVLIDGAEKKIKAPDDTELIDLENKKIKNLVTEAGNDVASGVNRAFNVINSSNYIKDDKVLANSLAQGVIYAVENPNPSFEDIDGDGKPEGWYYADWSNAQLTPSGLYGKWRWDLSVPGNMTYWAYSRASIPASPDSGYPLHQVVAFLEFPVCYSNFNVSIGIIPCDKNGTCYVNDRIVQTVNCSATGDMIRANFYIKPSDLPTYTRYVKPFVYLVNSSTSSASVYFHFFAYARSQSASEFYADDNLNMRSKRIINVATPTDGNDAVNKNYVDPKLGKVYGIYNSGSEPTCNADNEGMLIIVKQSGATNKAILKVCMQNGSSSYNWKTIVENAW